MGWSFGGNLSGISSRISDVAKASNTAQPTSSQSSGNAIGSAAGGSALGNYASSILGNTANILGNTANNIFGSAAFKNVPSADKFLGKFGFDMDKILGIANDSNNLLKGFQSGQSGMNLQNVIGQDAITQQGQNTQLGSTLANYIKNGGFKNKSIFDFDNIGLV